MAEGDIGKLYAMNIWPLYPYSERSKRRYREALVLFENVVGHEWVQRQTEKEKIDILEICAGTGIGGVALARALLDVADVNLTITDIRENDLKIGAEWGKQVIGERIDYAKIDAKNVNNLGKKFDIALLYGLSSPHFDPWEMIRLQLAVSESLVDDGLFLVEEADRRFSIFFKSGYKTFLSEKIDENSAIVSIHAGYNFIRGTFRRVFVDIINPKEKAAVNVFFWGLAELMAIMWMFFQDIDFYEISFGRGIVMGFKPRRIIKGKDIRNLPRIFRKEKQ
ncbi:MAG: hypothetical protein Q6363_000925 [Candidatus Njordarchaeota archaeon]